MPGFAEFAAAPEVGDDVDAAALEPEFAGEVEARLHVDSIAAVAVEDGGGTAIGDEFVGADDVEWDGSPIRTFREGAFDGDAAEIDGRGGCQRGGAGL